MLLMPWQIGDYKISKARQKESASHRSKTIRASVIVSLFNDSFALIELAQLY